MKAFVVVRTDLFLYRHSSRVEVSAEHTRVRAGSRLSFPLGVRTNPRTWTRGHHVAAIPELPLRVDGLVSASGIPLR